MSSNRQRYKYFCGRHTWVNTNCKKTCGTCAGGSGGSGSSGKCGVSKVAKGRVIKGVEAQPGAWLWLVSLQTSSGFHFCGGSVLTPTWVSNNIKT